MAHLDIAPRAYADLQRCLPAAPARSPISRAAVALRATIAGIRDRRRWNRQVRSTVRELSALDDRVLRDIGITRGEIMAVALARAADRK
jgi:uncharacterized protein YjiS (DUF1127 family)